MPEGPEVETIRRTLVDKVVADYPAGLRVAVQLHGYTDERQLERLRAVHLSDAVSSMPCGALHRVRTSVGRSAQGGIRKDNQCRRSRSKAPSSNSTAMR